MSGPALSEARAVRFTRIVLVVAGGIAILLALAAGPLGLQEERGIGPAQVQVAVVGALLLAAGASRGPGFFLIRALGRARSRRPSPGAQAARPSSRQRGTLAAIVLLALVFRLWMVHAYWPSHQMVMGMSLWDAEMARNLLKGRGWTLNWDFVSTVNRVVVERSAMVDPEDLFPAGDSQPGALDKFPYYAHTPGYAVWLAASFLLGGGHRFIYSQWMQSGLDSLACLLAFGIGRRLWSTTAGIWGALVYALSPAHVYLAIQTVAAATDSFWVIAIAYGAVRTWSDLQAGRTAWIGVLIVTLAAFGGTVMNSTAFVLPAVVAAVAVAIALLLRTDWRMAGYMMVAQLLLVILLIPWGIRNRMVYGHFAVVRETFWQLAWETLGQLPNQWGLGMGPNDEVYKRWIGEKCPPPCRPAEREAFTRRYLVSTVFPSPDFPKHLMRLIRARLPGLVYVARLPADRPYVARSFPDHVVGWGLSILDFAGLLMFPAALFGLVVLAAGGRTLVPALLGLAPSAFVVLFSLLFFVEHRKTTPAYGYLLALSGVAIAACVERDAESSR